MTKEPSPGPELPTDPSNAAVHAEGTVQTLKQAMRRARFDNAERAGVMADLRAARLGRLEMLQEALRPLMAQIPLDVDLFDMGLMPGVNPRLFVDMIGFVEMGRDAKLYRFLQDTRHQRIKIAESEEIDVIVEAVTDYVARRLLERDKTLAADMSPADSTVAIARPAVPVARNSGVRAGGAKRRRRWPFWWLGIGFAFLIDLLGSITLFALLAGAVWIVWSRLHG